MTRFFSILCAALLFCQCALRKETARGGFESSSASTTDELSLLFDDALSGEAEPVLETTVPEVTYISYRIKKGDMIGIIAENYGVSQDTLISMNGINNTRAVQIGSYVKIPSLSGIRYTVRQDGETIESIAKKYEVEPQVCSEVNHVSFTEPLKAGAAVFVPGGKLDAITLAEINGDLFRNPLRSAFRYTDYYGWRRSPFTGARSYHTGIDMAAPRGTPIYAAMVGVVVTAGWSATYGNYVIISHHSGYRTLYGHMDRISVSVGRSVSTSTKIGTVGNTGLSTGPHLHFTVYKNSSTVNPIRLMK
jgi:murein DD-endopeptidase MepM/ murein hydrolase activator NlpD